MVMEGDLTCGGEHTIQYTDDVLQNCTLETCTILLTNVTSINSIKNKKKKYGFVSSLTLAYNLKLKDSI